MGSVTCDGKYIKGKIWFCFFFFVNLILKTKIWIYGSMECKIKNSNFISPQQALTLMQELNLLQVMETRFMYMYTRIYISHFSYRRVKKSPWGWFWSLNIDATSYIEVYVDVNDKRKTLQQDLKNYDGIKVEHYKIHWNCCL